MPNRLLRHLGHLQRDQSGAVAIEFVLIAPILFALLFGIVTLGYFIGVSHSVHQLAAGAARTSVAGLDEEERASLANTYLSQAGTRYPLLIAEALRTTVDFDDATSPGVTVSVVYEVDGTLLDLANGFLGLGIASINGSAYVAY